MIEKEKQIRILEGSIKMQEETLEKMKEKGVGKSSIKLIEDSIKEQKESLAALVEDKAVEKCSRLQEEKVETNHIFVKFQHKNMFLMKLPEVLGINETEIESVYHDIEGRHISLIIRDDELGHNIKNCVENLRKRNIGTAILERLDENKKVMSKYIFSGVRIKDIEEWDYSYKCGDDCTHKFRVTLRYKTWDIQPLS